MNGVTCTYELREDDRVVATGRLTFEELPVSGKTIRLGSQPALVSDVRHGSGEPHLVLVSG